MKRSRLPDANILQSVVEWRYPRAHRYWDDCGKLIAEVERAFPGLVCQGLQPDGFSFEGVSGALTGAKFYWDKANVSQVDRTDPNMPDAAARFWQIVAEGLALADPARLGHRSWMIFETPSIDAAVKWLDSFSLWRFPDGAEGLGHPLPGGCVLRTKLEPAGRSTRIEVNAGTSASARSSRADHCGVIVDTDIVIESPTPIPADPAHYLRENQRFLRETVQPFFRGR